VPDTVVVTGVGGPAGRAAAAWLSFHGFDVVGTDAREVETATGSFRLVPSAVDPAFEKALLDLVSGVKASGQDSAAGGKRFDVPTEEVGTSNETARAVTRASGS
jgi:nucleoside-diphosphate-sugar epimerase